MKIALSYAMAGEIASILPPEAQPLETVAGVPFYAIDENITAYCGGIGKVNAAVCTQILIDQFQAEVVINTGIAHKEPGVGQIGAGIVYPPIEVFEKAAAAMGQL